MAMKKQENKYYDQLEKQFKELAQQDRALIKKPSREEIIQHIDVASALITLNEHHKDLSTVHNGEGASNISRNNATPDNPYKNKSFIDTKFRGTKYFDFGTLIGQVGDGQANVTPEKRSQNMH